MDLRDFGGPQPLEIPKILSSFTWKVSFGRCTGTENFEKEIHHRKLVTREKQSMNKDVSPN